MNSASAPFRANSLPTQRKIKFPEYLFLLTYAVNFCTSELHVIDFVRSAQKVVIGLNGKIVGGKLIPLHIVCLLSESKYNR
jgi:hypothetical protein